MTCTWTSTPPLLVRTSPRSPPGSEEVDRIARALARSGRRRRARSPRIGRRRHDSRPRTRRRCVRAHGRMAVLPWAAGVGELARSPGRRRRHALIVDRDRPHTNGIGI
ncbi:hypothetical protein PVAP13_4KG409401 [Panicum virgatum]|uniref:Uncharacterized protein n=1 Tax=Panicum virgatum TaxID=38727 RepID=A0A8T0TNQ1_PANVG|nr:hypothetical protein PVAP13_4KG409401 [Panicum virgatum]